MKQADIGVSCPFVALPTTARQPQPPSWCLEDSDNSPSLLPLLNTSSSYAAFGRRGQTGGALICAIPFSIVTANYNSRAGRYGNLEAEKPSQPLHQGSSWRRYCSFMGVWPPKSAGRTPLSHDPWTVPLFKRGQKGHRNFVQRWSERDTPRSLVTGRFSKSAAESAWLRRKMAKSSLTDTN
ncbi:hypothetical protein EMPG_15015 [Blastomyces silverae]|uniref:Uncharacterized protein n=1 Tax=Blastomyces silverae TaxID=2060906 RepID=A0A0H1BEY1_9EURO|nr:hypothetical protein EMPG_15015 [Blastomyces silverae]